MWFRSRFRWLLLVVTLQCRERTPKGSDFEKGRSESFLSLNRMRTLQRLSVSLCETKLDEGQVSLCLLCPIGSKTELRFYPKLSRPKFAWHSCTSPGTPRGVGNDSHSLTLKRRWRWIRMSPLNPTPFGATRMDQEGFQQQTRSGGDQSSQ